MRKEIVLKIKIKLAATAAVHSALAASLTRPESCLSWRSYDGSIILDPEVTWKRQGGRAGHMVRLSGRAAATAGAMAPAEMSLLASSSSSGLA